MMIGVGVSMDGRRMRTIDIMARCMNMAEREGELKKQRQQRLTAIEIDRDLAAALAQAFPAERLALVNVDVLEHDFSAYAPGFRV
ncbi:MAG TPA: hypothetical protein VM867_07060, partial [Xanthobacteraceae bacterium]|nr:hypothetical protein [Xanthobacteraceae bacterium]